MSFYLHRHPQTDRLIGAISDYVDDHNRARGIAGGHLLRIRVGKIAEELGEVEEALIAVEGSNPRKPQRLAAIVELETELLDVILAAAGAWYHLHPEPGLSVLDAITLHVFARAVRAGLIEAEPEP